MAAGTRKNNNHKNKTLRVKHNSVDKCIFVPLHDGLGNQLFIYAAALVAKKKLKMRLCTLPAKMSGHSSKNYRKLLFTNTIPVDNSDPEVKGRMEASTKILTHISSTHMKWLDTNISANRSKNVILPSTYFQNYEAIKGVIPEMRKQVLKSLEQAHPELTGTIDAGSAFMHVRRGDYNQFGQALDKSYYQNGLKKLSEISDLKKIYVFSNDLDWCKAQGFTVGPQQTLEMKDEPDELKALYLMIQCKRAAIISASTFSLWAAIFGAGTHAKPVILYPKHWFLSGNSSALELPKEGWSAIDIQSGGSQRWAIVQYDDRNLSDVDKGFLQRNKYYADKWGHEHIVQRSGYTHISPYWRKVFLVNDILKTNMFDGVLWLDTDATMFNMDTDLNHLVEEGKHMYKSADVTPDNKKFCAGVWFVLNTPIGKEIISNWARAYPRGTWSRDPGGRWSTSGEWAGPNYEQGAFIKKILPKYAKSMKHYHDSYLQALGPSETAFILHYYFNKDHRADFLENHPLPYD